MRLDARRALIVLTGAWNPAVLNPGWIALHLFKKEENTNIQVRLVQNIPADRQIIFIDKSDIGYYADNSRVEFYLNNYIDDSLDRLADVVKELLIKLPHTPLGGFGINIAFIEETPSDTV